MESIYFRISKEFREYLKRVTSLSYSWILCSFLHMHIDMHDICIESIYLSSFLLSIIYLLSLYISLCLSKSEILTLSIHPSIYQSIYLSNYKSLSSCLLIYLFIYLYVIKFTYTCKQEHKRSRLCTLCHPNICKRKHSINLLYCWLMD